MEYQWHLIEYFLRQQAFYTRQGLVLIKAQALEPGVQRGLHHAAIVPIQASFLKAQTGFVRLREVPDADVIFHWLATHQSVLLKVQ